MRSIFIPLLGFIIPITAGIITYHHYTTIEIIGASLYFIFTSFCIWRGCNWIHSRLRPMYGTGSNSFVKIASISMVNFLYGACSGGIFAMIWFSFSKEIFVWGNLLKFIAFVSLAVIVFTLVYEVLYLSKERELDTKIVDQLDRELTYAEMEALKNELDPHFIFNSLNILSHLINTDPKKAHLFNKKLAGVYKYFLINKDRDLISMDDELEFLRNYFYLLQIKHDDKLLLDANLKDQSESMMILPFALQVLVENAIKHNEFSEAAPLQIQIALNGGYVKISNNVCPKAYQGSSIGIGLKNLRLRYKLQCKKDIIVENNPHHFIVKLPIIQSPC